MMCWGRGRCSSPDLSTCGFGALLGDEIEGCLAARCAPVYTCYQEYFVALDFKQHPEKLTKLLAAPDHKNLLSYTRELDLWSSSTQHFTRC